VRPSLRIALLRGTLRYRMLPPYPATEPMLTALRDKYREIKRLRDEHASGSSDDPKARMKALALRFPGALRELDELPMDLVELRLATLEAVVTGALPAPQWVMLQIGYHALMRLALRIKRMARDDCDDRVGAILVQLAAERRDIRGEPLLRGLDRAEIEAILKPEGGRLNPWVYRRVAALHGVEPENVRRALFLR
jgi:hypothetical protein